MAIWIKTQPDAEPVWMAADNRIRDLALSIERRASIAPDAGWASANPGVGNRDCLPMRHGGACAGAGRTDMEEFAAGCVPARQQSLKE